MSRNHHIIHKPSPSRPLLGKSKGRYVKPTVGWKSKPNSTSCFVKVRFDDALLADVNAMAKHDDLSFHRALMQLIEWGLMDWKDAKTGDRP